MLLAAALRLVVGHGLVNYDTLYALVWGRDLAHGALPDYDVALAPDAAPAGRRSLGVVLTPLSDSASGGVHGRPRLVDAVLAFLALAALGWVVYALGRAWFGPAAGRARRGSSSSRAEPVLDFGARAYVDIPYLVLVLGALLVETRRPRRRRAGARPAGARRAAAPEAWLFSAAYVGWLGWRDRRLLAASPPPARRCCGRSATCCHRRPAALADRHARQRRDAAAA